MMKRLCAFLFMSVSLQTVFCQPGMTCQRPDGEEGNCIVFQNCEYYINLYHELGKEIARNILRKAQCGYEERKPKVCCPIINCTSPTPAEAKEAKAKEAEAKEAEAKDYVPAFLDPPDCGVNSLFAVPFVAGGISAELNEFPWMALLGYETRIGYQWNCGGALITERHVLTAAHCIYNREHMLHVVRLGELDYAREDDGAYPIDFLIKRMIIHEEYNPNNASNDIGILILQKDVQFTNSIRPICIPKGKWRNATFEGCYPSIAGWGRTSYRGQPASHLQTIKLPVRDNNTCLEAFRGFTGRAFDQRMMCAGYKEGGRDSCLGDSGAPLMQPFDWMSGRTYSIVIGVISYGLQCGYYGVYTRVTYFLPWIEEKVLGHTTD